VTYFLDLDDALEQIHFLGFHVRDVGLLQSSLARPNTTLYGADAYASRDLKAAALMHSIVTSHPLIDGNKRTAWALMITFVLLNGFEVVAETDDAFDFVLGVATESRDLDSIASWIAAHRIPHSL
jgi:death-on-curing protein